MFGVVKEWLERGGTVMRPTPTRVPNPALLPGAILLGGLLLLSACQDRDQPLATSVGPGKAAPENSFRLEVSRELRGGSAVTVALGSPDTELAGVQGVLSWDPASLRLLGQLPQEGTLVLSREEGRRSLVLLAVHPQSLERRFAFFVFESLRDSGTGGLHFRPQVAADRSGHPLPVGEAREVTLATELPAPSQHRSMTDADWIAFLGGAGASGSAGPRRAPGTSEVFGDITRDGAVNVLDVLQLANTAVGVYQCFVGSGGPNGKDCLAGNVRPSNLPGLGEPGDECPPGIQVCGAPAAQRTIDVLDVLAVRQEAVGLDQAVVGEPIPRSPVAPDTMALPSLITGTRILTDDTVYLLPGLVSVGDTTGLPGELILRAGARVEGVGPGAGLIVQRNGILRAEGTEYQPVTLTCQGSPFPGCWQGLILNGNARINLPSGTPSPGLPGRSDPGGCHQAWSGPFGPFGGCNDADSSGELRWVRILYPGGGGGLELRGVGSGTLLRQVFVGGTILDGVKVLGGTAEMKEVRISSPGGHGLSWDLGWRGRFQFGVIQAGTATHAAILGSNQAANPGALPRSAPVLRNLTLVGPPDPDPSVSLPSAGGIRLQGGTAGVLRSLLVVGQPSPEGWILDVDGPECWGLVGTGELAVDSSLVVGYARLGEMDSDPAPQEYASPDGESLYLRADGRGITVRSALTAADSILRFPWADVPDLRPKRGQVLVDSACPGAPPGDPFFEANGFCGAATEAMGFGGIPWFEPAPVFSFTQVPLSPVPALLHLRVVDQLGRAVPGVLLLGDPDGIAGVTGPDGYVHSFFYTDAPPGESPGAAFYFQPANLQLLGCTGESWLDIVLLSPGLELTPAPLHLTCS